MAYASLFHIFHRKKPVVTQWGREYRRTDGAGLSYLNTSVQQHFGVNRLLSNDKVMPLSQEKKVPTNKNTRAMIFKKRIVLISQ